MFSRIFLGLVVSSAMVSSTYSAAGGGVVGGEGWGAASGYAHSTAHADNAWNDIFPSIAPAAAPGHDYIINQIASQIQNPNWNGILDRWHARLLPQLNAEQLTKLAARIREIYPNGISFAAPTMITEMQSVRRDIEPGRYQYVDEPRQVIGDMPLAYIPLSIEIPFRYEKIDEIIGSKFDHAIMGGAKRNTPVADGISLGTAWSILNEFIEHYRKGLGEANMLLASAQLSPQEKAGLEKLIEGSSQLFNRLAELHTQIKTEFEKPKTARNADVMS